MTEFVASNGLRISALPDGQVRLSRSIPGDSREQVAWMTPGEAVALREFFTTPCESKPWHDAEPGEVWVLTFIDGSVDAFKVDSEMSKHIASWGAVNSITAGRRIWPEVSHD